MVCFAIYVSVGRLIASNVGAYREIILAELNSRVPFDIEARNVTAQWHSFTPELILTGLRLGMPGQEGQPVELSQGRIGLDVPGSLRTLSLQATRLELDQLSLRGELDTEGNFRITGFGSGGGDIGAWIEAFLLNIERLRLTRNTLDLTLPSGESRRFGLDFDLLRQGSYRHLEARLRSPGDAVIDVLAEGVGNPLRQQQFHGDLYLSLTAGDLEAIGGLFAGGVPDTWADGRVDLEVWLNVDRGEAEIETRVAARDLLLRTGGETRQFPLESLAFNARLVQRTNRWTLYASDVELAQADSRVRFDRVQADAWGRALRLRLADVQLAPLQEVVYTLGLLPEGLAEVARTLDASGQLDYLQVSVSDFGQLLEDWEVSANFSKVQAQSWKGAPGVAEASGYAEFAPGGGLVVLDSQQFALELPTIYERPLEYKDIHGSLYIDWDEYAVSLSSGLIRATASEGTAHALFGLNIPLGKSEAGLEMDLLVGLEDVHPRYRAKYVPYILNQTLRDWLQDSVGEGTVEEGAFLWRGSLRRKASDLHTIQLFFNVTDTYLEYHPDWPAVDGVAGTVLIDDTNISVWANQVQLHNSRGEGVSAEAWMNDAGQMQLAISGAMAGPAADGLRILNESYLRRYVGDAFSEWSVEGSLETRLDLQFNLGDKNAAPEVALSTRWSDVSLDIQPGGLPLRGLEGGFDYSSRAGFSSEGLHGELWSRPLTAQVSQQPPLSERPTGGGSTVVVDITTEVDMADIRRWLSLDFLAFAQGRSAVDVQVRVPPGGAIGLAASSELAGVSLDLPPPWQLDRDESGQLSVRMPLSGGISPLTFTLGEALRLALDVSGGELRAAAVALGEVEPELTPGELRVTGATELIDADAWNHFLETYFSAGFLPASLEREAEEPSPAVADQEQNTFPAVVLEGLSAQRLVLLGREFEDVDLRLRVDQDGWRAGAQTDWVTGSLAVVAGEPWQLRLQDLDWEGLSQITGDEERAEESAFEVPTLDVTVDRLRSGDRELGSLDFQLYSEGPVLTAADIHGNLSGIRVPLEEPGKLVWQQGDENATALNLALEFEDFGESLMALGYEKILETESGRFDISLQWPGGPQDFSLETATGSVRVDVEQGSFLEASAGATGALKVVSILNLASIVQRLSLSQMFDSGIPFDTMDGEFYLHGGAIEVPRLDVRGASSRFQFSALSEVSSRSLDGELVATLPVANNLPWVAALAGGLPVAAGVFVVSKLFEKQFDLLSSAVYDITGTWNDPQVAFARIWDDGSSTGRDSAVAADPQASPDPHTTVAPDPQVPLNPRDMAAPDPQAPGPTDQSGSP